MDKYKRKTLSELFWRNVQKSDGCWEWSGSLDRDGYGARIKVCTSPTERRRISAHRASWELHKGPIPEGMWVLHHCDNPPCVNPDHLFLGTSHDNFKDMVKKGRNAKGVRNAKSKLTEDQVREIRSRYVSIEQLAEQYGVHKITMRSIVSGQTWTHVV